MTTKLDTFTFTIEPEIRFEREHNVARKDVLKKFGSTKEWMGAGSLRIILTGQFTNYSDRDQIRTLFASKNTTVTFYSDTISFGTAGSPVNVWLINYVFVHSRGVKQIVDYTITLEEQEYP